MNVNEHFAVRERTVIEVRFIRGEGVPEDPYRNIVAIYDVNGIFLAEWDPKAGRQAPGEPTGLAYAS